jgi:predicted nuclease with RNAse H fold
MITLGIDLASQPTNTATCVITWGEKVAIDIPSATADDEQLVTLIGDADRVGIDVPFGWPLPFVNALSGYYQGRGWMAGHGDAVQLRKTDQVVKRLTGKLPLSVSSDKTAIPAMRAAHLLSAIDPDMDRSGQGRLVEVYPAAALRSWGFPSDGYKGKAGQAVREALVQSFLQRTRRWVEVTPEVQKCCVQSDHAFDALVAAIVARAAHLKLVHEPDDADMELARVEGWIALPLTDSLDRLATSPSTSID